MSKGRKKWKTLGRITEATFGGCAEASTPQSETKYAAPTGTATEAEVATALAACYAAGGHMGLCAHAVDEEFAAELGVELRANLKGQKLALQKEDLPPKADFRLEVVAANRDGRLIERRLGGTIRHNRCLGLAVAAGRALSNKRKQDPAVQEQAKLLGMEASQLRASKEQKRELFSSFFSPYTVRVDLEASRAYLDSLEPKKVSRSKQLRNTMKAESLLRVDALIASLKANRS